MRPVMRRLLPIAILLAIGGAASLTLPLAEWNQALADWGQSAGPMGALLAGLLFIPVCIFMLPATTLTYAIAFAFGMGPAVLGVEIGAVLGASASFLIGRHFARDLVARNTTKHPRLGALDRVINQRSFGMLFLIRLSPLLPFALVSYALGASRANFWRHMLATGAAILPQVIVTCWVGSSFADLTRDLGTERAKSPVEYALIGVGIVVALVTLAVIGKRTKAALSDQLEDQPST